MKKIILITVIVIFTLGCFYSFEGSRAEDTSVIYVDDNYNSSILGWAIDHFDNIQDAIDNAEIGDMIYIYNGTYYEHVNITKSINLIGENKNNVIIDDNGINIVINDMNPVEVESKPAIEGEFSEDA